MNKVNTQTAKSLINESKPLLIDFFASWCGPCKMLAPILEELSSEYQDKVNIIKIDVDEESLAQDYGVMSIPTLIMFKDGKEYKKIVGFQPKAVLESLIKEVI